MFHADGIINHKYVLPVLICSEIVRLFEMKRKDVDEVPAEWSLARKRVWNQCPPHSTVVNDLRGRAQRTSSNAWMKFSESFHAQDWISFVACKPPLHCNTDELENRLFMNVSI